MKHCKYYMRVLFFLICFLFPFETCVVNAQGKLEIDDNSVSGGNILHKTLNGRKPVASKSTADSAYRNKDYAFAIACYEALLKKGVSPTIFYNLGNAYFRQNDLTKAILNYERALKYAPSDGDAKYNLKICQSKLGITENPPSEMFFVTWTSRIVRGLSSNQWGMLSMLSLALLFAALIVNLLFKRAIIRKLIFVFISLSVFSFVLTGIFASLQLYHFNNEQYAVVMEETTIESDDAKQQKSTLRPGLTVKVLERGTDGKILIKTKDEVLSGWGSSSSFESI